MIKLEGNPFNIIILQIYAPTRDSSDDDLEEGEQNPDIIWEALKMSMCSAAEVVIPKKEKEGKQEWINEHILNLMCERKRCRRDSARYKQLNKKITEECNKAKEKWLNDKCEAIEKLDKEHRSKKMHAKIKEITIKKTCAGGGCIKNRHGDMLFDQNDIDARWEEYITELYADNREEKIV